MSIELKQVAEQSLDLSTPTLREMVTRHAAVIDSRATLEDMPEALAFQIDMARALLREFAAIQQAEAQQPATPEPVLTVEKEPDYWASGHFYEGNKPYINPTKVWHLPIGTKLYTHPSPCEPSLIEKAISSGWFVVLPVKATIPMCKAGWRASGGELTFQEIGHIYEEMYKARPLLDDADKEGTNGEIN